MEQTPKHDWSPAQRTEQGKQDWRDSGDIHIEKIRKGLQATPVNTISHKVSAIVDKARARPPV